ncbi:hypothetical protein KY363_07720, partial [Candidatus Woesearchaeota archaeon]|nr:hypothetical protein [Candidatus Woesearchaeota archaeon]
GSVDAVVDSKKKMSLDGGYEQQFLMAHGADPFRRCLNEKHIEKCVSFKSAQGPKYDRAYSELMQAFLKRTQDKD